MWRAGLILHSLPQEMAEEAQLEQSAVESVVPQLQLSKGRKGKRKGNTEDALFLGLHHQKQHARNGTIFWLTTSLVLNASLLVAIFFSSRSQPPAPPAPACSSHGHLKVSLATTRASCACNSCFHGADCSLLQPNCVINLDHGDPKMYELHWQQPAQEGSGVTIPAWHRMSYFADFNHFFFMDKELDAEIRRLHHLVGNAVTQGKHILVGTGSTQLIQAALYALSSAHQPGRAPATVVSAVPYYSCYHSITTLLKSGLYHWEGDASTYVGASEEEDVIELVASPNNPDGKVREHGVAAVNKSKLIFDLAYYWPQYTPMQHALQHDVMLFTASKATGHAGTRIGWAIVDDEKVARKMAYFIEVNSIGVSQEAQLRATQLLRVVVRNAAAQVGNAPVRLEAWEEMEEPAFLQQDLFHYAYSVMDLRWRRLREALSGSKRFRLPHFQPANCSFFARTTTPAPAFLWLECLLEDDCQEVLRQGNILSRSGHLFGADRRFVRVSMVDRTDLFQLFVDRIASLSNQFG